MQRLHLAAQTKGGCISQVPSQIRWYYTTCPSPLGREYEVLIDYKLGGSPSVYVVTPCLRLLTSEKIPHLYEGRFDHEFKDAVCLCLYMSKYGEWSSMKLLTDTIVPWVDLWLLYFEYWLATGEWEGGGEHPE